MGTRKLNPFMKFMATFRKQNKGKYDFKQMGREAGKAWRKVKGGGKECEKNIDSYACKKEIEEEIAEEAGINQTVHKNLNSSAKARAFLGAGRNRRTQKRRR